MSWTLDSSYARCQRITRRAAKNFYYSFLVLPRDKRRAMCALYAFLRHTDDLGDNQHPLEWRRESLRQWRHSLDRALAGSFDLPIFPALAHTVTRYRIPPEYLYAVLDGVEMDLEERLYETFAELSLYCQRVASAVGLSCIHIWGFSDPAAIAPARAAGLAFQLTNILRDLKEDADMGRVYLPQEDLRRFDYSGADLRAARRNDQFTHLMQFQIARAEQLYEQACELFQYLAADGQAAFGAMLAIYRGILLEIKRRDGDVFSRRIRLSGWHKLRIAVRFMVGGPTVPVQTPAKMPDSAPANVPGRLPGAIEPLAIQPRPGSVALNENETADERQAPSLRL